MSKCCLRSTIVNVIGTGRYIPFSRVICLDLRHHRNGANILIVHITHACVYIHLRIDGAINLIKYDSTQALQYMFVVGERIFTFNKWIYLNRLSSILDWTFLSRLLGVKYTHIQHKNTDHMSGINYLFRRNIIEVKSVKIGYQMVQSHKCISLLRVSLNQKRNLHISWIINTATPVESKGCNPLRHFKTSMARLVKLARHVL